jgi:zinc protease
VKRPPPAGPISVTNYPDVAEQRLHNGMRVLTVEDTRFPIVSVQLAFPVGRVNNPDDNLALLQLAVEAVREGTETRTAREIADELDYWAVNYSSELFMESTVHSLVLLERHLERGLELMSDMLLHPVFPEEELEKIRVRWASQLTAQRSQPEFLTGERMYLAWYGGHPYSKNQIPIAHLPDATGERVREAHHENFGSGDALLAFAGPVSPARSLALAEQFFGNWSSRCAIRSVSPPEPASPRIRIKLVDRPNSVQSRLLLGARALPVADPDIVPIRVMNQILGGGASARLFLKLREEKGYTYGAYSRLKTYQRDGLLLAGAGLRSDVTREAIQEVFGEFQRLGADPPAEEELARGQSEMIGAFVRQLERPGAVAGMELRRRLSGLPTDYYRKFPESVSKVTPAQVQQLAGRFLCPEATVAAVAGDRKSLEQQLQGLGELELFNIRGDRLPGSNEGKGDGK